MGRAFEFRKARKMKRWSKMAKTFTRIGKDLVMAVKSGGPHPDTNSRLRQVMQNAKSANMPKENVLRAIKKASNKDTVNYEEISLEGYALNGIAIFIDCATNNNNRTVADIRSYFSKCDGALGKNGSLEFIFDKKGVFTIDPKCIPIGIDDLEMTLIDAGLQNLEVDDEAITVYCNFSDFNNMQLKLEELSKYPFSLDKANKGNPGPPFIPPSIKLTTGPLLKPRIKSFFPSPFKSSTTDLYIDIGVL